MGISRRIVFDRTNCDVGLCVVKGANMNLYELTTIARVKAQERFALISPEGEVLCWYKADHGDLNGMWALKMDAASNEHGNKWSWFMANKLVLKPLRQP